MSARIFVCVLVLFCVLGFSTYYIFKDLVTEKLFPPHSCSAGESCVRFCRTEDAELNLTLFAVASDLDADYKILRGKPCPALHLAEDFRLTKNGFLNDEYSNDTYEWNEYCLLLDKDENELTGLTCAPIYLTENTKELYPWLILSSIPFLLITLVIFGLKKAMRTLHGKCVMSYIISLIVMYIALAIVGLYNHEMLENGSRWCKPLGYTILMSILMCFLWLNVMCYNTWRAIRLTQNSSTNFKRFFRYCLYAFGTPIVLIFVVSSLSELELIPAEWRTGIGTHSCSISDPLFDRDEDVLAQSRRNQFIYMYGPILVILACNLVFYALTKHRIVGLKKAALNFIKNENYQRFADAESIRFNLYSQFCVMMTLAWSIEFFSWLFIDSIILHLASIINCIQGFIIFVIFACRNKEDEIGEETYTDVDQHALAGI